MNIIAECKMTKEDLIIELLIANLKGIKLILQTHPDRILAASFRRYADVTLKLVGENAI